MSTIRQPHEFDSGSTPEAAERFVKRMSSGASLSDEAAGSSFKDEKVLKMATFSLQKYLKEPEFAAEFLERGGLESLCDIIRRTAGNTLAYALNSFTSLMEHDAGWESFSDDFVVDVAHIMVSESLPTICRSATAILLKIVCTDPLMFPDTPPGHFGYAAIHRAIEREPEMLSILVQRLQSQEDYVLCLNSLRLLSAMVKHVTTDTTEHQSWLSEKVDELKISKSVLRLMKDHPSEELKGQLLEFQSAMIHNMNRRRKTPVSMQKPLHAKMLNEIWDAAKVGESDEQKRDWKKLGFSKHEKPEHEFATTGVFGLERMYAYAKNHADDFPKTILEKCPFAKTSTDVTNLLCSHWNINTDYTAADFEPLLLSFDHIHDTTLACFYRIFEDMEAEEKTDFPKVAAFVRSQLRYVLKSERVKDLYEFDCVMKDTPYSVIRDRRLKEIEWADDLLGREAIRNLRTRLNKQSYEFIKKQRISCLLQGAWFFSPSINQRMGSISSGNTANSASTDAAAMSVPLGPTSSTSGKRWRYYKLSTSKKCLQYGDFAEKSPAKMKNYENLPNKVELISVASVKSLRKPSNASAMTHLPAMGPGISAASATSHQGSMSESQSTSFGLYTDNQVLLAEFICASSTQASEWKDGFSMLFDKGITSKDTAEYLHALTEIGIKVKLLQIAGDRVEVPHGTLEVPPVPPGLGSGFFYDTNLR